jgi:hypothetical protein
LGGTQPYFKDYWEFTPDTTVATHVNSSFADPIEIFPNPNAGCFVLKNLPPEKDWHLEIQDAEGVPVFRQRGMGCGQTEIRLKDEMAGGIYYIILRSESAALHSSRLIVVKE